MKPLYFRLKGFKGLKIGLMNIDEFILDFENGHAVTRRLNDGIWETITDIKFSPFSNGIIALQGTNKIGKSTIFKNMHPFLMTVASKKKIQDQCFLRDSEKEYICLQDGIKYRTLVLIDAKSEKAEAYIYKGENKESLNNGLLNSYCEAVEKIFGSEEIFANVLHSSRKLIPITQMKPAARKEIFYYYLGSTLTIFEEYDKIAKKKYDEAYESLEKTRNKITFIQEQLAKFVTDEAIVSLGDKYIYKGTDRWRAIDRSVELIGKKQSELETLKAECIKKADELKKKIQTIDEQLTSENHKLSLVDETEKKIKELEGSITDYETSMASLTIEYSENVFTLDSRKTEIEKEIARKEHILGNESKIKEALEEIDKLKLFLTVTVLEAKTKKSELENEISQLNLDYQTLKNKYDASISEITNKYDKQVTDLEKEFTAKQSEYQLKLSENKRTKEAIESKYQKMIDVEERQYSDAVNEYSKQQQEIKKLELERKSIEKEMSNAEILFEQNKDRLIKEMERAQRNAELIDRASCTALLKSQPKDNLSYDAVEYFGKKCANTCELLQDARLNRDMIGAIASQQINLQNQYIAQISEISGRLKSKESEIQTSKDSIKESNRSLVDQAIKGIEEHRNTELSEVLDPEGPSQDDYQCLVKLSENSRLVEISAIPIPEKPDTLAQTMELSRLKETILKETQQRMKLESLERAGWVNIKKEFDEVALILPEKRKALAEIEKQISEADERYTKSKNEIELNKSSIQLQVDQLKKQADREQIQEAIDNWQEEKRNTSGGLLLKEKALEIHNNDIQKLNLELETINKFSQEKAKEETELSITERKVERLAFIREGLSKNGIPALIIHNVGIEVAQIANDFLKNTDSGIRISFDTLKPTKNGYKESFEIGIEDNGNTIDIEDVNDGGTCWVDESINKAMGIYLTSSRYSNHTYQSEFSDEKDGALSPENKHLYLSLMEASLAVSKRDNLFMVTHTDSIWKQIPNRIHLHAGGKIQVVS